MRQKFLGMRLHTLFVYATMQMYLLCTCGLISFDRTTIKWEPYILCSERDPLYHWGRGNYVMRAPPCSVQVRKRQSKRHSGTRGMYYAEREPVSGDYRRYWFYFFLLGIQSLFAIFCGNFSVGLTKAWLSRMMSSRMEWRYVHVCALYHERDLEHYA